MRILVTGSAGHLGEALMRTLAASEHDVLSADIVPSAFTHAVGSITNRRFVRQDFVDANVNDRARAELGWSPTHDFASLIARLHAGGDLRSPLARAVGSKGYHRQAAAPAPSASNTTPS